MGESFCECVVLSSFQSDGFKADFRVFLVLSPDLIVDTVSSRDSSSSCTRLRLGDAGSGGGFSDAQYRSSLSAIATVNIVSLVF